MSAAVEKTCLCPVDSDSLLLAKINNNLVNLFSAMTSGAFKGQFVNLGACRCSDSQILATLNNNIVNAFSVLSGGVAIKNGKVALVAGQQSYVVIFAAGFTSAPGVFIPTIQMPSSTGEEFNVSPDLSTLTKDSVTVWLDGIPTAASAGGQINWIAQQ